MHSRKTVFKLDLLGIRQYWKVVCQSMFLLTVAGVCVCARALSLVAVIFIHFTSSYGNLEGMANRRIHFSCSDDGQAMKNSQVNLECTQAFQDETKRKCNEL